MRVDANAYYERSGELFNRLAPPIDLSGGGVYAAPHLRDTALLELAKDQFVIVQPESEPLARELQDYRLFSLTGLAHYMSQQGVSEAAKQMEFLRATENTSWATAFEEETPGMLLLCTGEEVILGRDSTPQLGLARSVSRTHAGVQVKRHGLVFADYNARFGTLLYLSEQDAYGHAEPIIEPTIDTQLRDKIFTAFSGLLINGSFDHEEAGLQVNGGRDLEEDEAGVEVIESPILELAILQAEDYPYLRPRPGYALRRITIDTNVEGLRVSEVPGAGERVQGVTKTPEVRELSEQEARELLQLAANLYRRR